MDESEQIKSNSIEDEGISVVEEIFFPFEKPTNFNLIPEEVIKRVSLYLTPVIYETTKNREVSVEAILNNTKVLIAKGRYYYDKDYWIQHCAASFREILIFVEPLHFQCAHRNIPDPKDPEIEKAFSFLMRSVTYLSSVVQHRPSQLMGDAEKLYPGQGYSHMNKEDFSKQEADFMERLCIDVIYTLNLIFSKYCVNPKV